ncbi:hypothetical protein NDU88_003696 [Pleurodeles waltl]|uniref:Reverse transcriptase domain-containing protein n=1 Tax=Pleurodeles waltl TaxID=8319 RepID=A0AAV7RF05_PLEWA|nr:hypothetical protein NDU88_003696 [Pleurodeles waltl]
MGRTLKALGLSDFICDVVTTMYRDISSMVLVNRWETDLFFVLLGVRHGCPLSPLLIICVIEHRTKCITQNQNIRGVTVTPSNGKGKVKCSLYTDYVLIYCVDRHSVKELERTSIEFRKASGPKLNSATSETLLFGQKAPTRGSMPFLINLVFMKIFGVWFGRQGAEEKTWEERLAK